jgi:ParB family chromosome partitioning protein
MFAPWCALAEIDENLIGRDLTPAQRAKLVAKRKAVYEAVHPETRR